MLAFKSLYVYVLVLMRPMWLTITHFWLPWAFKRSNVSLKGPFACLGAWIGTLHVWCGLQGPLCIFWSIDCIIEVSCGLSKGPCACLGDLMANVVHYHAFWSFGHFGGLNGIEGPLITSWRSCEPFWRSDGELKVPCLWFAIWFVFCLKSFDWHFRGLHG